MSTDEDPMKQLLVDNIALQQMVQILQARIAELERSIATPIGEMNDAVLCRDIPCAKKLKLTPEMDNTVSRGMALISQM